MCRADTLSPKLTAIISGNMSTEYLDRLARLLKIGKSAACIRAINRILAEMKERCEAGKYSNQTEAESAFRRFVEDESACRKAKSSSKQG